MPPALERELLRTLVQDAPVEIAMFDRAMRYLFVSRRFAAAYRLAEGDFVGRSHYELFPEMPAAWRGVHERVLAGETLSAAADPFPRADGSVDWVRWTMRPWRDASGAIGGAILLSENITEQKRIDGERARLLGAEQQARSRLGQLQAVTAAFSAARSVPDVSHAIVNQAQRVFGAGGSGLALLRDGGARFDYLALSGPPEKVALDWQTFPNDLRTPYGVVVARREPLFLESRQAVAERFPGVVGPLEQQGAHSLVVLPLIDSEGTALGAAHLAFPAPRAFDESERRVHAALAQQCSTALERALHYERERAARELLAEADRRKDEFLAMLAHELRNPLAPIANAVKLLEREPGLTPLGLRGVEMIERQARQMRSLVEDLLEVNRITRGTIRLRPEPIVLGSLVLVAVEAALPAADAKRQSLRAAVPTEPVRLTGDPVRLSQVLENLLGNAVKYTPEGGRIDVSLHRSDDGVEIRVADDGIGIAPEKLGTVFELFVQAEPGVGAHQGGLGIGLALVKRLVELHGGTVHAESPGPGRGATFVVRLPPRGAEEAAG